MQFLLWPMRIVIYPLAAWLGLGVIMPAVGGGVLGLLLSAPTASLAIALDVFVSSKVKKETIEQNVAKRLVALDRVLGDREEHRQLPEAEAHVEEIIPPQENKKLLP